MVDSFYDPEAAWRGLEHNAHAHRLGVPYLYLGYWIQGSPKMSRKKRFQPQAQLTGNAWSAAEKALPRLASPTMTFVL